LPLAVLLLQNSELAELTSVAGSEGEPLFFNYLRDMLADSVLSPEGRFLHG